MAWQRGRVFAVVMLACAGCVWAQGQGNQPRMVLQALDTDHDGSLSAAEVKAAPESLLVLDKNKDGELTSDEWLPRPENAGASPDELVKRLMSLDANGDGVLTKDEVPARMQNLFQRGDTNHDGKLTTEEIRAMADHQGMPAGLRMSGAGAGATTRMDPLLNALDADHDGTISGAEIAAAAKVLTALDTNGDGVIGPEEMRMRQTSPAERVQHMLDEWDTNKDGKVSKAEAPDRMQQQFDSLDKNGDGFLDREELTVLFSPMGGGDSRRPNGPGGAPKEQHQ